MFLLLAWFGCATPDSGQTVQPDNTDNSLVDSDPVDEFEACEGAIGLNAGDCPPEFALLAGDGSQVSLGDFPGQRIVVIGTATW